MARSEWAVIDTKNPWGEPAWAVVHDTRIRHGFATKAAAEADAIEKAKAAAGNGESAVATEISRGERRLLWPQPATARRKAGAISKERR